MKRKLQLYKCKNCNHINPLSELINTISCLKCRNGLIKKVEGGYAILNNVTYTIEEIHVPKNT